MTEGAHNAAASILEFALGLPGAYEDFPWGDRVVKVQKKIFIFLGSHFSPDKGLAFSVKLPISGDDARQLPFTTPTGYGLGKSGWVTVRFLPDEQPPLELLLHWIEESYRAVAPKKLIAQLDSSRSLSSQ